MKVRRLRKFVIPTIYTIALAALFISILIIGKTYNSFTNEDINSHVVNAIVDDDSKAVMNETENKMIKPFVNDNVTISKNFYDKDATEEEQQNSLIYYENTYMQNSGVLYTSENAYDIVATLDGKISDIKTDDILGNVIEIDHDNEIKTVYQSVDNIKVKVGDEVKQGDVIATSGANKLNNTNKNCLLFEVYQKGQLVNPEKMFETKALEQ
ncbi:MAG TPA: M23 family metallopeptidase [Bacilli bacterium]|jgi:stage II sporulation protein Q|nr:M23 family metallopeptidase [Bacilli bacterium]